MIRLWGRVRRRMRSRLARRGRMPLHERVHWYGTSSPRTASRALAARAARLTRPSQGWALSLGDDTTFHRRLNGALEREGVPFRSLTFAGALAQSEADLSGLACIVLGEVDAARSRSAATQLVHHPLLQRVPFEYVAGLEPERRAFARHDEYPDTFFISPVLDARPSPYDLYEESLAHFEQKCGLRDYLDLYQWLSSIHQRGVSGAVAEFGSYKGHSGWLIARTMQAIGLDRPLYMFDSFEAFPEESAGVDYFWSRSHGVDFDEVRSKLATFPRVELVRGDFTETWPESGAGALALTYVDCDSYRAVSYVANLFEDAVSPGGVMIFEDYGHPALLGCRVAVHEYFDGRRDCLRFFSQFSGLYVVMKTGFLGQEPDTRTA